MLSTSESSPPLLPPELLHIVFEHVDKRTLSSCSLVCHSWLPVARLYLFRVIKYSTPAIIGEGLVDQTPPLLDLLEFLEKTSFVGSHIHVLSLEAAPTIPPEFVSGGGYKVRVAPLEALRTILRLTPNLQTLELLNLRFENNDTAPNLPYRGDLAREHLDGLHIEDRGFDSFPRPPGHALQVLSLFGSVGTLNFDFHSQGKSSHAWPHRLTRVQTLHLNTTTTVHELSIIDLDHLKSFSLYPQYLNIREVFPLFQLFVKAGHSLQHVQLPIYDRLEPGIASGLAPDPHTARTLAPLTLSVLQGLQSITFTLQTTISHAGHLRVFPAVRAFVARALSELPDTLRTISLELNKDIHFPPASPDDAALAGWSELDAALAQRVARRGLRSVRISFQKYASWRDVNTRSCAEAALPRTLAEGVLRVD